MKAILIFSIFISIIFSIFFTRLYSETKINQLKNENIILKTRINYCDSINKINIKLHEIDSICWNKFFYKKK